MVTKLVVAAAMVAGFATGSAGADPTVVRTADGTVRGTVAADHRVFQGIPFAAPPVGDLRWRSPQPVEAWSGVRDATKPGARCPQTAGGGTGSAVEDCLYLNVTTPRTPGRKPVVVWLHGGGNSFGAGSDFGAARFAAQGDVVVVTTNFRLGLMSAFAHPTLRDAGGFGLEDQQAALRWVRDNVAAFGGDPARVALVGESGGAFDLCAQLTSPGARGLFQRAVLQSGTCSSDWPDNGLIHGQPAQSPWMPAEEAQARGAALAAKYGCADVDCLRRVPAADLMATDYIGMITSLAYGNSVLPTRPDKALAAGRFHRVPVIAGHNRDEGRLAAAFTPQPFTEATYQSLLADEFGDRAPEVAAEYPSAGAPIVAYSSVLTDRVWACEHLTDNRVMARRTPVFTYEFADRNAPTGVFQFPPGLPGGAFHGAELPYLFDTPLVAGGLAPAQERLATQMIRYWSRFAATGDPNGPGLPAWPAFRSVNSQSLAPGATTQIDTAAAHNCGFWN